MKKFNIDSMFDDIDIILSFVEGSFPLMYYTWYNSNKKGIGLEIINNLIYKGVNYVLTGEENNYLNKLLDNILKGLEDGKYSSKPKSKRKKTSTICSKENITTA